MSNYNKMMQKHFAAEKAASDKRIKRATRRLTRKSFEYVVEYVGVKAILRKENGKWVEHAYHATGTGSREEVLRDYPLPITKKELLVYLRKYQEEGYHILRDGKYVDRI